MTDLQRLEEVRKDLRERIDEGFERTDARIDTGFAQVNGRLDTMNGRVGRGEVALAQHDVRLRNLERQIFHRRREDESDEAEFGSPKRGITERDVKMVLATVAITITMLTTLTKILPAVIKALAP